MNVEFTISNPELTNFKYWIFTIGHSIFFIINSKNERPYTR